MAGLAARSGAVWWPCAAATLLLAATRAAAFSYPIPALGFYNATSVAVAPGGGTVANASFVALQPDPSGLAPLPALTLTATFLTQSVLRVRVAPSGGAARWSVPDSQLASLPCCVNASQSLLAFELIPSPLGFRVVRRSTGAVIFDTTPRNLSAEEQVRPLLFYNQYLEIATSLPNGPAVYGLGERITSLKLPLNSIFTLWNADQGNPPDINLYGSHPFALRLEAETMAAGAAPSANGVFLFNSNAMDALLGQQSLAFRAVGGVVDLFFFAGPTPAQVVMDYTSLIGKPAMPPRWALDFHQCRWGYETVNVTRAVVSGYNANGIPLGTIWNDIDYMDQFHDFTLDPARYPADQMKAFHDELAAAGQHHVYIVDPAIPKIAYPPYVEGLAAGVFIGSPENPSVPLESKVWPAENTVFPDFSHPNAQQWWSSQVGAFFLLGGAADGLWIDMNEPSSFCVGQFPNQCRVVTGPPWNLSSSTAALESRDTGVDGDPAPTIPPPPYVPGGVPLEQLTINMSAVQALSQHYNVHNMYGLQESNATYHALLAARPGRRPFVLSRSTFPGSGRYAAHWTGDNDSTFSSMRASIAQILSFAFFGIPFVGSDICGFNGNTTEELCARWFALGAFYPFSRNHNSWNTISQEAYAFGSQSPVLFSARVSLQTRRRLGTYLYTLFRSATDSGATVMRPLFFEFPEDTNTWGIDSSFMWGSALLFLPVLDANVTSVTGYVPQGTWWQFSLSQQLPTLVTASGGAVFTFQVPLSGASNSTIFTPILLRGGYALPLDYYSDDISPNGAGGQSPGTLVGRGLLVAIEDYEATGFAYYDDGESDANALHISVTALPTASKQQDIYVSVDSHSGAPQCVYYETVNIVGASFTADQNGMLAVTVEHYNATANTTLTVGATAVASGNGLRLSVPPVFALCRTDDSLNIAFDLAIASHHDRNVDDRRFLIGISITAAIACVLVVAYLLRRRHRRITNEMRGERQPLVTSQA